MARVYLENAYRCCSKNTLQAGTYILNSAELRLKQPGAAVLHCSKSSQFATIFVTYRCYLIISVTSLFLRVLLSSAFDFISINIVDSVCLSGQLFLRVSVPPWLIFDFPHLSSPETPFICAKMSGPSFL